MPILEPKIEQYLNDLLPERESVVQEMEEYAEANNFPIVGPLVGRLCYQIVKSINAKRIFEMGSGFGYSTYWLARGLAGDGKIIFTEYSQENIKRAEDFLGKTQVLDKVEIIHGDAIEALENRDEEFDLILNDIDKEYYPKSLKVILPRLRKGGILITDNLIWNARVVEAEPDAQTRSIMEYTKMIYDSPDLWTTIIPLRDGVGISYKLN
ncbi:O-methyltransferase [candidate division KSB1 bacterium]|nr:O-methyltransferase [candidate division KSB1 bacterium]MCH7754057.1 O-methyltransferase [candidate division KSB1 bacterium]MCH8020204.1 O-methyltransferase [candidate division KSB1 bacterium]